MWLLELYVDYISMFNMLRTRSSHLVIFIKHTWLFIPINEIFC